MIRAYVSLLAACAVICVYMNDGGSGIGRCKAIGDYLCDSDGNAGLPVPAPRAIKCCLDPNAAHMPSRSSFAVHPFDIEHLANGARSV